MTSLRRDITVRPVRSNVKLPHFTNSQQRRSWPINNENSSCFQKSLKALVMSVLSDD